jgi:hypothetical protein
MKRNALLPFNTGAQMIALKPIASVSGRSFGPGDAFPWRQLALGERRARQMYEARMIGELTQENLAACLRALPEGRVPRGFTVDGLKAMGLELPKGAPASPAAGLPAGATPHRGRFLVETRKGNFRHYDVYDAQGGRLNPGGQINGLKRVDLFLDGLDATAAAVEQAKQVPPPPAPVEETAGEDVAEGQTSGEGGTEGETADDVSSDADYGDELTPGADSGASTAEQGPEGQDGGDVQRGPE